MNRSVKSLLSVSVLAPVAALAVAAAPANAAPGPSTTLLYESYAAAAPAAQTLPEPVIGTAGQAAELTTLTVDGVLQSAPAGAGALRSGHRSAASAQPVPPGVAGGLPGTGDLGDLPGTLLGSLSDLGMALDGGKSVLPGTENAVPGTNGAQPATNDALPGGPGERRSDAPLSMPLAGLPSALTTSPAGLPLGTALFPPAGRYAQPDPAEDVLGQANDTVDQAGAGLDETEKGVGQVVEVLKARERAGRPADGPVSLLDTSGLGLPGVPGLG